MRGLIPPSPGRNRFGLASLSGARRGYMPPRLKTKTNKHAFSDCLWRGFLMLMYCDILVIFFSKLVTRVHAIGTPRDSTVALFDSSLCTVATNKQTSMSKKFLSHLIIGNFYLIFLELLSSDSVFIYISTDYGYIKAKSLILCGPNSNPNPQKYLGCGYKGFCRNNDWIMENMDKRLTLPKWVLIVWPKMPKMPQNLSAQFVCPSPKYLDFNEKRLHCASVVRVHQQTNYQGKTILISNFIMH